MAQQSRHHAEAMRGICYHYFITGNLPTWLKRIIVCYIWGFVGHSGLQCCSANACGTINSELLVPNV